MTANDSFKYEEVLGLKFGYSPFGKPKLFTHIYYVDGLLIDTGPLKVRKQVLSSTLDLKVDKIFITHHHEDHTGNIHQLENLHNCKVYAPEMTCEIMKKPPKLSFIQKVVYGERRAHKTLIPVKDIIETKNFQFQLIPVPGHAYDMVCLYEPNRKWLFSADLYVNSYIGYFISNESIKEQIESTRKILNLDFDTMFCAHNPQLENGKDQLNKKLGFLETFFQKVKSLYLKGYSDSEIFSEMKLKENKLVKLLSGGQLSKLNMVKSVINDVEKNSTQQNL
ncbi:MBL fold metallo-hydrolase [Reichenbachiella sp.]